jgi:lysozyme family protein
MAQGRMLDDEQVEAIRMAYLEAGGVVKDVARSLGVSEASVRKYGPAPDDDFAALRAEKKADIIGKLAAARLVYLDHLTTESTVKAAPAKDAAIVFGVLVDKHQLLTGKATERIETRDLSDFTDDQLEKLAVIAAEHAAGARPS